MRRLLATIAAVACSTAYADDAWLLSRAPLPARAAPEPEPAVEPEPVPLEEKAPADLTYEEAQELALAKGKPLVVWIGGAVCPSCIGANVEEFIHFFSDEHTGFPPDSLTVGVPSNGKLLMAGQVVSEQEDGGWPDGHIPTVRRILHLWHQQPIQSRKTITSVSPPGSIWSEDGTPMMQQSMAPPPPVRMQAIVPPPVRVLAPPQVMRRFMMRGAACAT